MRHRWRYALVRDSVDVPTLDAGLPVAPLNERARDFVPYDHDPQHAVLTQERRGAGPGRLDARIPGPCGGRSDAVPRLTVVMSLNIVYPAANLWARSAWRPLEIV